MSDKTPKLKEESLVKQPTTKKAGIKKSIRKRPATKKAVTSSSTKKTSKKAPSPKTVKSKNITNNATSTKKAPAKKAPAKKTAIKKTVTKKADIKKTSQPNQSKSKMSSNSTAVKNKMVVETTDDISSESNVLTSFLKPKEVSDTKHQFIKKTLDENLDLSVDYEKIKKSEAFLRQLDDSPWLNKQLNDLTIANSKRSLNSSKLSNQSSSKMKVTADVIDVTKTETKNYSDNDQAKISHFKPTKLEQLKTIAEKAEQEPSQTVPNLEVNHLNSDDLNSNIVSIFANLSKPSDMVNKKETESNTKTANKNTIVENTNEIKSDIKPSQNTPFSEETLSSQNKDSSEKSDSSSIKVNTKDIEETQGKKNTLTLSETLKDDKTNDSLIDKVETIEESSDSKLDDEQDIESLVLNEKVNESNSETSKLASVLEAQIEFLKNIQIPNESCAVNLKPNTNEKINDVSKTKTLVNHSLKNTQSSDLHSSIQDDRHAFENTFISEPLSQEQLSQEQSPLKHPSQEQSPQEQAVSKDMTSPEFPGINEIKNNELENSLTQSILNEGNSEIGIYTDQHIMTSSTIEDTEVNSQELSFHHLNEAEENIAESNISQLNQNFKEHNIVSGSSVEETKEEDQATLDFQAALNAVNLKKPEKVKPTIDVDSIRSDLNKVQNKQSSASAVSSNNIDTSTSSEPDNKSDNWYKMAAAYVSDKKDKIVTTLADSDDDEATEVEKALVYQDVKVEGLFGGVGNAIGNGFKNIGMIGVYTKIGLTEGAKDSKNVVTKLISKVKN